MQGLLSMCRAFFTPLWKLPSSLKAKLTVNARFYGLTIYRFFLLVACRNDVVRPAGSRNAGLTHLMPPEAVSTIQYDCGLLAYSR